MFSGLVGRRRRRVRFLSDFGRGRRLVFRSEGAGGWFFWRGWIFLGGGGWIFVGFGGGGWIFFWFCRSGAGRRPSPKGESRPQRGCCCGIFCPILRATAVMWWRENYENFSTLFRGRKFSLRDPEGSPIQNLKGFIKILFIKILMLDFRSLRKNFLTRSNQNGARDDGGDEVCRPEVEKSRLEADFSKRKFGARHALSSKSQKPQNPKIPKIPKTIPKGPGRRSESPSESGLEARWAWRKSSGPAPTLKILEEEAILAQPAAEGGKSIPKGPAEGPKTAGKSARRRRPRNRPKGPGTESKNRPKGQNHPNRSKLDRDPLKSQKDLGPSNLKIGSEARGGFLDQGSTRRTQNFVKISQNRQNRPKLPKSVKSAGTLSRIERQSPCEEPCFDRSKSIGCRAGCHRPP